MAITKEWRCAAHGPFENASGRCPRGCSKRFVRQEFRTAPSIKSTGTARVDKEMGLLAKSYALSDIRNGADGESVMQTLRKAQTKQELVAPRWGQVEHAAPGWSQREGEKSPTVSASAYGAVPENQLTPLVPTLKQPTPLIPKGGSHHAPLPEPPQ